MRRKLCGRCSSAWIISLGLISLSSCGRNGGLSFRVIPAQPDYLLRNPSLQTVPFPEVLGEYTDLSINWVQLRPFMELRIENAYYEEGAPKHGLADFLGTETIRYRVQSDGALRQTGRASKLPQQPPDQPPVSKLVDPAQQGFRYHRYFYQVVLNRATGDRTAILIGAASVDQLDLLTRDLLKAPEATCNSGPVHCTIFPEACTVSLEIEVIENGRPKITFWGSTVATLAPHPDHLELSRLYHGRLIGVHIDIKDPRALRLPLLPGDHLNWK